MKLYLNDVYIFVESKQRKSLIEKGIKVFPFEFKLKGAINKLQTLSEFQNEMP